MIYVIVNINENLYMEGEMFHAPVKRETGKKIEKREFIRMPAFIDKPGTLFSYGSLLDHERLREQILEINPDANIDIQDAVNLMDAHRIRVKSPNAIVIVHGAELEGIRANIIRESRFGEPEDAEHEEAYLYVRKAKEGERPRYVAGGIIIGLTKEFLQALDEYEMATPPKSKEDDPQFYRRAPVDELRIDGKIYSSRNIEFYEGIAEPHQTDEDREATRKIVLGEVRKRGEKAEGARWPETVRKQKGIEPKKKAA